MAYAISNAEDPQLGWKIYWMRNSYHDMPIMGINGSYLTGAYTHHSSCPQFPDDPGESILIQFSRLDDLMNGSVPEGALLDSGNLYTFRSKDLFAPGMCQNSVSDACTNDAGKVVPNPGFVPTVQRGAVSTWDGQPEPGAAFIRV
jgi:hypothetical protein